MTIQQEFLWNLSLRLSEEDRDKCEGLLSLSELTAALGNMSKISLLGLMVFLLSFTTSSGLFQALFCLKLLIYAMMILIYATQ